MQPNQTMQNNFSNQNQQNYQMQQQNFQNQPMQQNIQMNQNFQSQPNPQMQQNFQNPQNNQMNQNFQNQPNPQMQQQYFQNQQPMQQNIQNQQMPQQNFQSQPNPQMNQNFANQPIQQNNNMNQMQQQNFQNPQMQQQNFQNPQMQQQNFQNQQMQQQNVSLIGSQTRPLPPKIPRNSNQSFASPVNQMSSQRIPLRSTSSMQSCGSMSLNQSMKYSSMQSMQSIGSSDSEETQEQRQSSMQSTTQTFPIIYNNITYKVDPELLSNVSPKFKELIQPYVEQNRLNDIHLEILCHNFTYRNINNFFKLCQNQPTDVENSEMKEISEIAKLFGAEKIYNTGVAFIRQNIDPNFSVPDNKYDGSDGKRYLFIEDDKHVIAHSSDISSNMNAEEDEESDDGNDEAKENSATEEKKHGDANSENSKSADHEKIKSVIYRVKVENHTFRCPVFHFYDDKNVLFTAKQKANNMYVGEGYDVHISSNQKNHVARIYQDNCLHNIIFLKDKNFKLKYVNSGKPNHLSLNVTFPYKDEKEITWTPKQPKYDPITDKYYLNFHGEYNHTPIKSRKNIVLQNSNGHPTFIVRKMNNDMYEIECFPLVDPLIVFVIGLSDIVGPYIDPLGEIDF